MTSVEPGKLRRSSKGYSSCNYWLTGPCCLLRQRFGPALAICVFLLVLFTLPGLSLQNDMTEEDSDLMKFYSEYEDSDEYSSEPADIMKLIKESSSSYQQSLLTSPLVPDVVYTETPPPPPALKHPPTTRSRLQGQGKARQEHGHQQRADPTVIASTPMGKIRGRTYYINKTGEWVGGFLGVPYAEPPIEQLRFRVSITIY